MSSIYLYVTYTYMIYLYVTYTYMIYLYVTYTYVIYLTLCDLHLCDQSIYM
jgi:hypothetical protein